ncbi:glycosyltransferase family 4 protein [Patescibacteria group bacterium]
MKIGIDAKNIEGRRTGVGRYLINLLKEWDQLELPKDVEFVLYFRKEIPDDLSLDSAIFQKKVLSFGGLSNALFMHILLPIAAYRDKIDVLFCPAYVSPIFYFKKTVIVLHDIIYEARPDLYNWPSIFDRILLRKFSKISAKRANKIIACSEYSKKEIVKYYKINLEKIIVNYLGVDKSISSFNSQKVKNKFILFVGAISNRRHLPEVMLAFERIAKKLSDYQFLVIGKNITSPFIDIDELSKVINTRLGRKAILRKDFISDKKLSLLYNSADALIWLSDYEGFGLPILEAMSFGTLVITSPNTSIPEVAGDSVLYVQDSRNIDEIYKVIYKGLTNIQLRSRISKKGLKRVLRFSFKKCASKTLNVLLGI